MHFIVEATDTPQTESSQPRAVNVYTCFQFQHQDTINLNQQQHNSKVKGISVIVFPNLNQDWQSKHELNILKYHILVHIPTAPPFTKQKIK